MKEKQFCRCCLSMGCDETLSAEYVHGEKNKIYSEMLLNTFNINVLNSSEKSCFICEICIVKLRNAAEFKTQVLKAQESILKGWNSLTSNIDLKIELDHIDDFGNKFRENFTDSDSVWDIETPKRPERVFVIKLDATPCKVPKENVDDVKRAPAGFKYKEKVLRDSLTQSGGKILKRKSVTRAKNLKSVKKVKTSKKLTKNDKSTSEKENSRYPGRQITQSEIDARENTLKLIQNSNLCLFRSQKTKFCCVICKANFVEVVKLRAHCLTHTNTTLIAYRVSKWRGLSFKNADISDLKCKQCSQNIHSLNELMNHLNEKHNVSFRGNNHFLVPYRLVEENQCALCELKFNTFLRLSMHMNTHYANNVCEICGLSFINRLSLRMHVNSQHREKKCSYCPAKFLTVASKTKHLKKDHNVYNMKRYCNMCDKTFPYTYMLDKHKIEEHGAKKTVFNCDECGKTFFHGANLRIHVRCVHIKERNYPCEVCGTRFFTKCDQKRHEKTHNDVRSFSCNYCEAKFKSKDSWRRHMKRQHGHVFK